MTHTKIQQKSNDSLHLLRFGRLDRFEDLEPPVVPVFRARHIGEAPGSVCGQGSEIATEKQEI